MAVSRTGLDVNTASALSYVLGPLSGVLFLIIEKDETIRFHAMQSTIVTGLVLIVPPLVGGLGFLARLASLLTIVGFAVWLILIYKAWLGDIWEVPVLGGYARRILKKI